MAAWFYILRLQSGVLYPGATTDLKRRWQEHTAGIACRTTRYDPPAALVYHESYATFAEARRREAQIKRWSGQKKAALVAGDLARLRQLALSHDHGATSVSEPEVTAKPPWGRSMDPCERAVR